MLAKMRMLEERGSEFCSRTIRDLSASLGSDGGFLFEGRVAKMSVLELAHTFMDPNTSKCAQLRGRAAPRHTACHPLGVCMVCACLCPAVQGEPWLLSNMIRITVQQGLSLPCCNPVTTGSTGSVNRLLAAFWLLDAAACWLAVCC